MHRAAPRTSSAGGSSGLGVDRAEIIRRYTSNLLASRAAAGSSDDIEIEDDEEDLFPPAGELQVQQQMQQQQYEEQPYEQQQYEQQQQRRDEGSPSIERHGESESGPSYYEYYGGLPTPNSVALSAASASSYATYAHPSSSASSLRGAARQDNAEAHVGTGGSSLSAPRAPPPSLLPLLSQFVVQKPSSGAGEGGGKTSDKDESATFHSGGGGGGAPSVSFAKFRAWADLWKGASKASVIAPPSITEEFKSPAELLAIRNSLDPPVGDTSQPRLTDAPIPPLVLLRLQYEASQQQRKAGSSSSSNSSSSDNSIVHRRSSEEGGKGSSSSKSTTLQATTVLPPCFKCLSAPPPSSPSNLPHHLKADAALRLGRSFRVGWGPNGTFVHVGLPPSLLVAAAQVAAAATAETAGIMASAAVGSTVGSTPSSHPASFGGLAMVEDGEGKVASNGVGVSSSLSQSLPPLYQVLQAGNVPQSHRFLSIERVPIAPFEEAISASPTIAALRNTPSSSSSTSPSPFSRPAPATASFYDAVKERLAANTAATVALHEASCIQLLTNPGVESSCSRITGNGAFPLLPSPTLPSINLTVAFDANESDLVGSPYGPSPPPPLPPSSSPSPFSQPPDSSAVQQQQREHKQLLADYLENFHPQGSMVIWYPPIGKALYALLRSTSAWATERSRRSAAVAAAPSPASAEEAAGILESALFPSPPPSSVTTTTPLIELHSTDGQRRHLSLLKSTLDHSEARLFSLLQALWGREEEEGEEGGEGKRQRAPFPFLQQLHALRDPLLEVIAEEAWALSPPLPSIRPSSSSTVPPPRIQTIEVSQRARSAASTRRSSFLNWLTAPLPGGPVPAFFAAAAAAPQATARALVRRITSAAASASASATLIDQASLPSSQPQQQQQHQQQRSTQVRQIMSRCHDAILAALLRGDLAFAVAVAEETGHTRLAMLLSQAGGDSTAGLLVRTQLRQWRAVQQSLDASASKEGSTERRGGAEHSNSHDAMNAASSSSSSSSSSLEIVYSLLAGDVFLQGENASRGGASPPLPPSSFSTSATASYSHPPKTTPLSHLSWVEYLRAILAFQHSSSVGVGEDSMDEEDISGLTLSSLISAVSFFERALGANVAPVPAPWFSYTQLTAKVRARCANCSSVDTRGPSSSASSASFSSALSSHVALPPPLSLRQPPSSSGALEHRGQLGVYRAPPMLLSEEGALLRSALMLPPHAGGGGSSDALPPLTLSSSEFQSKWSAAACSTGISLAPTSDGEDLAGMTTMAQASNSASSSGNPKSMRGMHSKLPANDSILQASGPRDPSYNLIRLAVAAGGGRENMSAPLLSSRPSPNLSISSLLGGEAELLSLLNPDTISPDAADGRGIGHHAVPWRLLLLLTSLGSRAHAVACSNEFEEECETARKALSSAWPRESSAANSSSSNSSSSRSFFNPSSSVFEAVHAGARLALERLAALPRDDASPITRTYPQQQAHSLPLLSPAHLSRLATAYATELEVSGYWHCACVVYAQAAGICMLYATEMKATEAMGAPSVSAAGSNTTSSSSTGSATASRGKRGASTVKAAVSSAPASTRAPPPPPSASYRTLATIFLKLSRETLSRQAINIFTPPSPKPVASAEGGKTSSLPSASSSFFERACYLQQRRIIPREWALVAMTQQVLGGSSAGGGRGGVGKAYTSLSPYYLSNLVSDELSLHCLLSLALPAATGSLYRAYGIHGAQDLQAWAKRELVGLLTRGALSPHMLPLWSLHRRLRQLQCSQPSRQTAWAELEMKRAVIFQEFFQQKMAFPSPTPGPFTSSSAAVARSLQQEEGLDPWAQQFFLPSNTHLPPTSGLGGFHPSSPLPSLPSFIHMHHSGDAEEAAAASLPAAIPRKGPTSLIFAIEIFLWAASTLSPPGSEPHSQGSNTSSSSSSSSSSASLLSSSSFAPPISGSSTASSRLTMLLSTFCHDLMALRGSSARLHVPGGGSARRDTDVSGDASNPSLPQGLRDDDDEEEDSLNPPPLFGSSGQQSSSAPPERSVSLEEAKLKESLSSMQSAARGILLSAVAIDNPTPLLPNIEAWLSTLAYSTF